MAGTQKASDDHSPCVYDVFLSFRGSDTRAGFTDHLHSALVRSGFHTFRDDDEIITGEDIGTELERAIGKTKVFVIVFSRDYASSTWCLRELERIMERRRIGGHYVLPVFYGVEPSTVRHQSGEYATAFLEHEKRFKGQMNLVGRWKMALSEVASLSGKVLGNRPEANFVEEIVWEIGKKLDKRILHVPSPIEGRKALVDDINHWLQNHSNVFIATISGIGGIGKTTVARIVYNLNNHRFDGSSFLSDVGETSRAFNGLVRLQTQLLSNLTGKKCTDVWNVNEGLMKIKAVVGLRRVLIVLDGVDDLDQFNAIIGSSDWISSGSRIIITTRQKLLMKSAYHASQDFEVEELGVFDSLNLFCRYAFGRVDPIVGYQELAEGVSGHCAGLPLALVTIGSSLSGKSFNVWKSTLEKLEVIMDQKVQRVLGMSYDLLGDDHDKRLFLDIACFFTGRDKDYVTIILEGCGFYSATGIQNLIDHNLLSIGMNNVIMMHPLIRDMGREIVRQESPEYPGKRSRLWHNNDVRNILTLEAGTETVKGLAVDVKNENSPMFRTNAFKRMSKLKLLRLDYLEAKGSFKRMPQRLVWLSWHGFQHQSLPEEFCIENLAALELPNSNLKHNWKNHKIMGQLKHLDLSHCHHLIKTPDFRGLRSLERLILRHCKKLAEINDSIVYLVKLRDLCLSNCMKLQKISRKICTLESLERLDLSYCSELKDLPVEVFQMRSLSSLCLDGVPIDISDYPAHGKKKFGLSMPSRLRCSVIPARLLTEAIPKPIASPISSMSSSLLHVSLKDCCLSDEFFARIDFSAMVSLNKLILSGNNIHHLPVGIISHGNLQELVLRDCKRLKSIFGFPKSLKILQAQDCESLEYVAEMPFNALPGFFLGCKKLANVKGIMELRPMTQNDKKIISSLSICDLQCIRSFDFKFYNFHMGRMPGNPLQIVHECGISSFFVQGSNIPSWYAYCSKKVPISITVPSQSTGLEIYGLNICIKIAGHPRDFDLPIRFPNIIPSNTTKNRRWNYVPSFWGTPCEGEDLTWYSHWRLDGTDIHDGDVMHVKVIENSANASSLELYAGQITKIAIPYPECTDDGAFIDKVEEERTRIRGIGVNVVYKDVGVRVDNVFRELLLEETRIRMRRRGDVSSGITTLEELLQELASCFSCWHDCLPYFPEPTYGFIGALARGSGMSLPVNGPGHWYDLFDWTPNDGMAVNGLDNDV